MKNFVQPGKSIVVTASGVIDGGDVVISGGLIGIAQDTVANGQQVVVHLEGVYTLPKATPLVITQGDKLFWNGTAVTKTSSDTPLGYAFLSALSAATFVQVRLEPMQPSAANIPQTTVAPANVGTLTGVDGSGDNAASVVDTQAAIDELETKLNAVITALEAADILS